MSAILTAILYFQKNKENNEESNRKKEIETDFVKTYRFLDSNFNLHH